MQSECFDADWVHGGTAFSVGIYEFPNFLSKS